MKQGFTISLENTTLATKGVPWQDIFISTEGFSDSKQRESNRPESKGIDIQISQHVRGEEKRGKINPKEQRRKTEPTCGQSEHH
jgi:hypothetical protein